MAARSRVQAERIGRQAASAGPVAAAVVVARPQDLVNVAVILAVEDQHRRPSGRDPGKPQGVGVRAGG